jgi:hypothetical protein
MIRAVNARKGHGRFTQPSLLFGFPADNDDRARRLGDNLR